MATPQAICEDATDDALRLYGRIGQFLADQHLDADPTNYSFAYHLFSDPTGALARAVAKLTEGGVRLTLRDIETLDCDWKPISGKAAARRVDGLVAKTQMQVEGFSDMVTAIRAEAEDFGRDLAASTSAMLDATHGDMAEIARITAAMLERVHQTEAQLAHATREASELREKLEEARDNARRDPLTDLPNRRAFEEAFVAQAATGVELCIALCDIDHFKTVNDRFGHDVGDRVLKAIGEALSAQCHGHLVARYGGEEFAILFSGATLERATATLNTARAAIEIKRYKLREDDSSIGEITISAGIAEVTSPDGYRDGLQRADRLLYVAKTAGRNCVRR